MRKLVQKLMEKTGECDKKYIVLVSGRSPIRRSLQATLGRLLGDIRKRYCTDTLDEVFEREKEKRLYLYVIDRSALPERLRLEVYYMYKQPEKILEKEVEIPQEEERKSEKTREVREKSLIKIRFSNKLSLGEVRELLSIFDSRKVLKYRLDGRVVRIVLGEGLGKEEAIGLLQVLKEKYSDKIRKCTIVTRFSL